MFPKFLYQSEIFCGLNHEQINDILKLFKYRKITKGKKIIQAGKEPTGFYIIISGEFKVVHSETSAIIAWARVGQIIGEIAIFTKSPHSTNVVANLDSEVLLLSSTKINALMDAFPQLLENIVRIEARRIRNQNVENQKTESERTYWVHITNMTDKLSSYMGLNLAMSMAQAIAPQKVAYLYLANSSVTLFEILNFEINKNQLKRSVERLKQYHNFSAKDWMHRHSSGIYILPPLPKELILKIKNENILPLLAKISESFPFIFLDLGSQNFSSRKAKVIINQADRILVGLDPNSKEILSIKDKLKVFKKQKNSSRIHFYANYLRFGNDWHKKASSQHSSNQLEKLISQPLDFILHGQLDSIEKMLHPAPLLFQKTSQRAYQSIMTAGRWMTNRKVGLALGGGGARGLANLGVLKELEKEKIQIDALAGTSMGALVGALYLMGGNSQFIAEIFSKYVPEDSAILDYNIPFISFFRGRKIEKILKEVFGKTRVEDLPIPFVAVAVDIISGREVHIRKGLLWRAVRASMSLPVVFPPVKYKNCYLIDGGTMNNVPSDVLRNQKIHHIIAVSLNSTENNFLKTYIEDTKLFHLLRPPRRSLWKQWMRFLTGFRLMIRRPPILQIAHQTMTIAGAELVKSKLINFDIVIKPEISKIGMFDFNKIDQAVEEGEIATQKIMSEIKSRLYGN